MPMPDVSTTWPCAGSYDEVRAWFSDSLSGKGCSVNERNVSAMYGSETGTDQMTDRSLDLSTAEHHVYYQSIYMGLYM